METKILIMCGGRGARLGDITKKIPKPLVKIGGVTILEHKIRHYMRKGFRDFIICVGYKARSVRDAVNKAGLSAYCIFSDAGEPAGILKRIHEARDLFGDSVVLTYGDTFADIDLAALITAHIRSRNDATIVVAPIQNPFGLVEFNDRGKVLSFREKPVLNYYIGYAIIEKATVTGLPKRMIDMPDGKGLVKLYGHLAKKGKLGIFYFSGPQITFNTADELKIARKKIVSFYTNREET